MRSTSPSRAMRSANRIALVTAFALDLPWQLIITLFTPNTGAGNWSKDYRTPEPGKNHIEYGVFNMGPCPLPGGKVMFTSNRNGFQPTKAYTPTTLQLFVMDDDGSNVELIGTAIARLRDGEPG